MANMSIVASDEIMMDEIIVDEIIADLPAVANHPN